MSVVKIKTKPVKLIKAILGHLLSAKGEIDKSVLDSEIREYIFDDIAVLSDNVHIFYWIYPYQETVILRDFALLYWNGEGKQSGFFQILKYFPIAFIVTNRSSYEGLNELTIYRNFKLDDEVDLPVRLKQIKENDWPERVDENTVLFMSAETGNGVHARPKKKIK